MVLHRLAHELAEIDALALQLHLAAGDPRHVEEVVDEPGQVGDLPLDDLPGPLRLLAAGHRAAEDVEAVSDRRERIAQLVGEHRQELGLAPVGLGQGLPGPKQLR